MERIRRSLRVSESVIAFSNVRGRPSQLRYEPLFSETAATGRTTSATAVIAECEISSETRKVDGLRSCPSASLEISSGSTPPTTRALMRPSLAASRISHVAFPAVAGRDSTPHALAISTRAAGSESGRPPGRRLPIAPARSAPTSPARRGIHATFAPL